MSATHLQWTIQGIPAPFATTGEWPWKQQLASTLPESDGKHQERGMLLVFRQHPGAHLADVDNLCEPVFSVLINDKGWFGSRRPNLQWWRAVRETDSNTGCNVVLLDTSPPGITGGTVLLDGVFPGPLPKGGRDTSLAEWAGQSIRGLRPRAGLAVRLQFGGTAVNLGDIATGPVKSVLDSLYPIFGGTPGHPDDQRVQVLQAEKGTPDLSEGAVRIAIWAAPFVLADVDPAEPGLRVSPEALREVEEAFRRYQNEVEASALAPNTKQTYLLHSHNFVRWLRDEFKPGGSKY